MVQKLSPYADTEKAIKGQIVPEKEVPYLSYGYDCREDDLWFHIAFDTENGKNLLYLGITKHVKGVMTGFKKMPYKIPSTPVKTPSYHMIFDLSSLLPEELVEFSEFVKGYRKTKGIRTKLIEMGIPETDISKVIEHNLKNEIDELTKLLEKYSSQPKTPLSDYP